MFKFLNYKLFFFKFRLNLTLDFTITNSEVQLFHTVKLTNISFLQKFFFFSIKLSKRYYRNLRERYSQLEKKKFKILFFRLPYFFKNTFISKNSNYLISRIKKTFLKHIWIQNAVLKQRILDIDKSFFFFLFPLTVKIYWIFFFFFFNFWNFFKESTVTLFSFSLTGKKRFSFSVFDKSFLHNYTVIHSFLKRFSKTIFFNLHMRFQNSFLVLRDWDNQVLLKRQYKSELKRLYGIAIGRKKYIITRNILEFSLRYFKTLKLKRRNSFPFLCVKFRGISFITDFIIAYLIKNLRRFRWFGFSVIPYNAVLSYCIRKKYRRMRRRNKKSNRLHWRLFKMKRYYNKPFFYNYYFKQSDKVNLKINNLFIKKKIPAIYQISTKN